MPLKIQFILHFQKTGRARYLAHRELLNIIEQAVRRADIPIAFSEGFNPRPRISFLTALPLGIVSEDEVMYWQLTKWLNYQEIIQSVNANLTEDIIITSCAMKHNNTESSPSETRSGFGVIYQIKPLDEAAISIMQNLNDSVVKNWMSQPDRIIQRSYINKEAKAVNIRQYVEKIELSVLLSDGSLAHQNGPVSHSLLLTINITNQGTARPDEVIASLTNNVAFKTALFDIRKLKTLI